MSRSARIALAVFAAAAITAALVVARSGLARRAGAGQAQAPDARSERAADPAIELDELAEAPAERVVLEPAAGAARASGFPAREDPFGTWALRARLVDPRLAPISNREVDWKAEAGTWFEDHVFQGRATSGDSGEVVIRVPAMPLGRYDDLHVSVGDELAGSLPLPDALGDGADLGVLLLEELVGVVAGRTVDARGAPVPSAAVEARIGAARFETKSDAEGRFALRAVVEDGARRADVRASRGARSSGDARAVPLGVADVVLVLRAPGVITGTVLHDGGDAPANLRVALRTDEWDSLLPTVEIGRGGRYAARDLDPGFYDVLVVALGVPEPFVVRERVLVEEGGHVTLPPLDLRGVLRRVSVRVHASDLRAPKAELAWRPSGDAHAPWASCDVIGTAHLLTPALALDLRATKAGYRPAELQGAVGAATLRLERGYPIALRLEGGEQLAGCRVRWTVTAPDGSIVADKASRPAGEALAIPVSTPGAYAVSALLDCVPAELDARMRAAREDPGATAEDVLDLLLELREAPREAPRTFERTILVLDTPDEQRFWIDLASQAPSQR